MTDLEFDILDELYFVISFEDLKHKLGMEETKLKNALQIMVEQKYIKCFRDVSDELPNEHLDFKNNYRNYHYLASKEGLFAHNSR
jgi:transcription initiation factor IIE alpha subunit